MKPVRLFAGLASSLALAAACAAGSADDSARTTPGEPGPTGETIDAAPSGQRDDDASGRRDASASDARAVDGARPVDATLDDAADDAASADAFADTSDDDATDAALDASLDAEADTGVDAPSVCSVVGRPCATTNDCVSGFECFGVATADASGPFTGVCLNAHVLRYVCGFSGGHCRPNERCLAGYDFCLYAYEVPCVCSQAWAAASCGSP